MQKIGKILRPILEKIPKSKKNTLFRPLIRIIRDFNQKNYLAQTVRPIILYIQVKNWEDP